MICLARQCRELPGPCPLQLLLPACRREPREPALMRLIDEQYTKTPFYGSPKMTLWLRQCGPLGQREAGSAVDAVDGIGGALPKKRASATSRPHRGTGCTRTCCNVAVERVNQVWSTDITYIRLRGGFIYLVAVMDWYSRFVLRGRSRTRWTCPSVWRLWRGLF